MKLILGEITYVEARAGIEKIEKWIKFGRILIIVLIVVALTSSYLFLILVGFTIESATKALSVGFIFTFFLLGAVTFLLIKRMRARSRLDSSLANVLGGEQKTLLVIFFLFELSFLFRAIFDYFIDIKILV